MKRKNFFLFLSLLIISVGFCQAQETTPNPTPVKKVNRRPAASKTTEPFDTADVKKMSQQCVTLETEAGNIQIEMFPESAPETVRNFLNLSATKFYDTTLFSRVVPNFIIQGGNFATRTLKPVEMYSRANRNVKDEPNLIKHERGIVSMARGDEPDSASTHFFILLREASYLDGKFAAFGRVIAGMEIVEKINKMPVTEEKPEKPVRLLKATVASCPVRTEPVN